MEEVAQDTPNQAKFEEILINEIRSYEHLWKVVSTKHKDLQRCENSWEEISRKLKQEKETCKSKWKYLRDTFIRKKKEYASKSGSKRNLHKKWEYFDSLTFLDSCEVKFKSATNIQAMQCDDDPMEKEIENSTSFDESDVRCSKRRKKNPDGFESVMVDAISTWKEYMSSQQNQEDEAFGRSIGLQIHKLSTRTKARVKLQIQQIICEAEESELMDKENEYPITFSPEGSFFQLNPRNT